MSRTARNEQSGFRDNHCTIDHVTGPRPDDKFLQHLTAHLITYDEDWNEEECHSPPFSSSPDQEPEPYACQHNAHRPELVVGSDQWPNSISHRVAECPVDEQEELPVNGIQELAQTTPPFLLLNQNLTIITRSTTLTISVTILL